MDLGGPLVALRQHVGVDAEGDHRRRMVKAGRDDVHRDPGGQEMGRAAVPDVMEPARPDA
jgi:hypothetical protein